ncbi:MAG: transposase [Pseudomonadota bacterium]
MEKKSGHASEQEREDVRAAREAFFAGQDGFDPTRLFFVDETGTSTKMARAYGRAPHGERCRAAVPHGHWQTTTFVGALTLSGIEAPMTLPAAMNGAAFTARVANLPYRLATFSARQFVSPSEPTSRTNPTCCAITGPLFAEIQSNPQAESGPCTSAARHVHAVVDFATATD